MFIVITSFLFIPQENIYNEKTRTFGKANHLIVTVEQLFKSNARHEPRLSALIRKRYHFQKTIKCVNIDEAHNIHTAGLPQHGLKRAFRPDWGRLNEFMSILPSSVMVHCFSVTEPPHIHKTIESRVLRPNYMQIRASSNRRNTVYAMHEVVNNIDDAQNYHQSPFILPSQTHIVIFVDSFPLTSSILDLHLPAEPRGQGITKHYHSCMSEELSPPTHQQSPSGLAAMRRICQ